MEDKGQTTLSFQRSIDGRGDSNIVTSLFSQTRCRASCAKMIIMDELSFKFVENEGFKLFCSNACPTFDPSSRVTIARDIFKLYLEEKKKEVERFFSSSFQAGL